VYGVSLHGELRYLVEAGLSPIEALRSATSIPADKFGLKDRGYVKAGLRADLLLVNGNPTEEINDAIAVEAVWRNGKLLDRAKAEKVVQDAVEKKSAAQTKN
jgi:imidazolonepropionase-like amidohydrolase